jgi:hypothetical protein
MHSSIGLTSSPKAKSTLASNLALVPPGARRSSAARFRSHLTKLEALADFVTVVGAVMSSYAAYYYLGLGSQLQYPHSVVLGVSATFAAVVVVMLDRAGAYSSGTSLLRVRETEHVLRVSMQSLGFILTVSFLTSFLFSRWLLVISLCVVPLFLFLQKHLVYVLVQHLHARGYGIERVLIYGSGSTGRRVYSVLSRSPKLGLEPVAFIDDNAMKVGSAVFELGYENRRSASVMHGPMTRQLVTQYAADLVVIAIPTLQQERFYRAVEEALAANARVSFVPRPKALFLRVGQASARLGRRGNSVGSGFAALPVTRPADQTRFQGPSAVSAATCGLERTQVPNVQVPHHARGCSHLRLFPERVRRSPHYQAGSLPPAHQSG